MGTITFVSDAQVTGAILFFVVVALLLGGLGLYYVGVFPVFGRWWERFKAWRAAQVAYNRELLAQRQREREIEVASPPEALLDGAIERMTRGGYGIESRTSNTVTFARHEGADGCVGCFLMLFFLIPGLLYLLLAQRTARVTVAAYSHEGGSRVVIGGDDLSVMDELANWARALPTEPGALRPLEQRTENAAQSLADKLRELEDLRGAGLITQEEYEAKRAELLGRI